ncbi:MAG: glutamine--tRNA ligase, partial [Bdellovibrionales bacterium]|nr:glutamine--tRNA ligase [Bdellovibrionales bacterium]
IEFARLNLTNTVMSKRKLLLLVNGGHVSGWDDPRMPTLAGFRRKGYTPEAIREFCNRVGVAKADSIVDIAMLEFCIREDLNKRALRAMAVFDPIKLVITNYPEGQTEELEAENNPEDETAGTRVIPFGRELYIERDDFMEDPPKKYFRLAPGKEVRLKHAYYVTCEEVIKDGDGRVQEIHCRYDPKTKGGWSDDGRKVKGTLHWVSAAHAVDIEARLINHLLLEEEKESERDFLENINPNSLEVVTVKGEPSLRDVDAGTHFQFLRLGYFYSDPKDHNSETPTFNRVVGLKDTWAKESRK